MPRLKPSPAISIHALRVEGDLRQKRVAKSIKKFLSTPSGWRATRSRTGAAHNDGFLSTPSGWRATASGSFQRGIIVISIHALRVEGDRALRRRTRAQKISIHALRVEGDTEMCGRPSRKNTFLSTPSGWRATDFQNLFAVGVGNFYPRPPGGGRPIIG